MGDSFSRASAYRSSKTLAIRSSAVFYALFKGEAENCTV
jgi:hypothetical protein